MPVTPDPAVIEAVKIALAQSRSFPWESLTGAAIGGLLAIVGGAVVQFLQSRQARSAFERDIKYREELRARVKIENAQVSALRLATTIEAYGREVAQRHLNPEGADPDRGGRYANLPATPSWPADINWEALGSETAGAAFAFQAQIQQQRETIDAAFDFDAEETIFQLVPSSMLSAARAAATTARAIRRRHQLPERQTGPVGLWDWETHVNNSLGPAYHSSP
jgi:hypothetical protein